VPYVDVPSFEKVNSTPKKYKAEFSFSIDHVDVSIPAYETNGGINDAAIQSRCL
jgi:hypothetical protein